MAVQINGDGLITVDGTSTTQGRVRLAEDTDNGTNYIELTAPALLAADRTITFPDATTTVVGTDTTQTLTNKTLTSPTISGTPVVSGSLLTFLTAQNSTSGTNIDFSGIPSWAKRITVVFNGVTNADALLVQLGTSGGIVNTGYAAYASEGGNSGNATTGFFIRQGTAISGLYTLINISGNIWIGSLAASRGGGNSTVGGGTVTLSGAVTQLRITGNSGSAFTAGSINVLYE